MKLTLTGFDNNTPGNLLMSLCLIHDIDLEIGILYHPKKFGIPRYPDHCMIRILGGLPIKKALHICGGNEGISDFIYGYIPSDILKKYDRIQLNADWTSINFRYALEKMREYQIILQWNEKNKRVFDRFWNDIPPNTQFLMDESRGNGSVLTRNWIAAKKELSPCTDIGFAGGISPDTIENDLRWIKEHFNNPNQWIDMESGIRTNNEIDPLKVAKVIYEFRRNL